jgi:hypothetical protein
MFKYTKIIRNYMKNLYLKSIKIFYSLILTLRFLQEA